MDIVLRVVRGQVKPSSTVRWAKRRNAAKDAEIGALALQNKCADPLVILDPTGGAGISDGSVVDATQIEVSIAPGAQTDFSCLAFTNSSESKTCHVTIPAVLGSTSIAISFDIAR